MTQLNRLMDTLSLSAAVLAAGIAACGGDATDNPRGSGSIPTLTGGPGYAGVGAVAAAGRAATPATGAAGSSIGLTPPVTGTPAAAGRGSTPPVSTPTFPGVGATAAGSTAPAPLPGTGAAAGSAAPAPTSSAGAAAPGSNVGSVIDGWDPNAGLDAQGSLKPPADGDGYQIATTAFDLQPGQEIFNCYHATMKNTAVFPVGEWDCQMSRGSHHFILYRDNAGSGADGTLTPVGCTMGFGGSSWLYTQGTPRAHLQFPEGVAMELSPNQRMAFDMHYINTGNEVIHAQIKLNVNKVKAAQWQKAGSQVSFNIGINVPPHGMQTVQGDCPGIAGANYFVMQTHTHKFATLAVVNRKSGGMLGEELVRTTNWDAPQARQWHSEPYLTFKQGESFHYACTYQNDTNMAVTVGTSADRNEMCMAEAYYFPANGNPPACN